MLTAFYLPGCETPTLTEQEIVSCGPEPVPVALARPGPDTMRRLLAHLTAARERELVERPAVEVVEAVGRTAERWLDRCYGPRAEAEAWLPRTTGYAPETIRSALDGLFEGLRAPALRSLVEEELGDPRVLDQFVARPRLPGRLRAYGPRLAVVTCAGNIPVASPPSLAHCLLLKSACLLRVSRAEPLLPSLFARSLAQETRWLAGCMAAVWWPAPATSAGSRFKVQGSRFEAPPTWNLEPSNLEPAEGVVIEQADAWIAYGGEATLESIRSRLPGHVLFQPHGHRIGCALIAREMLEGEGLARAAASAAADVASFDQQGCVSPRVFFVEEGGARSPLEFARALAERLEAVRESLPRRPLAPEESASVHQRRAAIEMRKLAGEPVALFRSAQGTDWTVIYDPDAGLAAAGGDRTVVIRPIARAEDLVDLVAPYRRFLQTAAVAADQTRRPALAALLGAAGVTRLCPLGRTAIPSPGWHHDGRPCLADLVRWVDWEQC